MSAVRRSGSAENCQTPAVERAPGLPNLSSIDPQLNGYDSAPGIRALSYVHATSRSARGAVFTPKMAL